MLSHRTTTPNRTRRVAATAAVLGLGAITVAFTAPRLAEFVPGMSYTFTTTTSESDESFAAAGKTVSKMVGKVEIGGDKARIEFAENKGGAGAPGLSKDGYIIMHDGGATMFMVDPKEKQYIKMDAKKMGSAFSQMSSMMGGMMSIDVKDPKLSVRKLGAGESILGYATEKWQVDQSYTMTIKSFGFSSTTTDESRMTMWFAPQLKSQELMNPFFDMARNLGAMFAGNKEWEQVAMGPSKELPQAAALKMEGTSKTTNDKGKSSYSITSMEMTDLNRGDIPAARFELPSGYKMVEMPDIAALSDSLKAAGVDPDEMKEAMKKAGFGDEDIASMIKQSAADGAKDQAKVEAREAGKDAVKAGFGRLLRRKP